jgi:hypothetical protein
MAELESKDVFDGDRVIYELLEKLEELYPLYNPNPSDSLAKIMFLAGQRSIVDYIHYIYSLKED